MIEVMDRDMTEFDEGKGTEYSSDDDSASLFEEQHREDVTPQETEPCHKSRDHYSGEDSLLNSEEDKSPGENVNSCNGTAQQQSSGNEDVCLSPTLLAELDYTPMRITRRMASLRNAFTLSLGLSAGVGTTELGKNGSTGVTVRKTGKRSVGRTARSGWAKSPIIDQVFKNDADTDSKVPIRKRKGKSKTAKAGKVVDAVKVKQKPGAKHSGRTSCASENTRAVARQTGSKSKKANATTKEADSGQGGEDVSSGVTEGETTKTNEKIDAVSTKVKPSAVGWVMCDECRKWRCISAELADSIEASDARWTCRENPNTDFSDCSVPQEKTNAEINAELNISEISSSEGDDNDPAVNSKSRVSWTQIRHNIFQHRRPKKLDDDDTLICHCKPPPDGSPGCGDDCLNRMMNVECAADTCPCGERCSNQQFAKRMYANVELIRCGKKGFGLRILEDVPKGTFIIEYVGEVLDIHAFEMRQKEYSRQRQKHFYFMTLNSSEVIDACRKGNLGRFINHSCDPNCQTEKWCVNGEICIGLFAIRDLVKDEEITFNYNFERLYGAAAKKCHCGSINCHGYIGGDPTNPRDVVQTDSEEDLEPIMLRTYESEDENIADAESVQETKVSAPPEVPEAPEVASWEPPPPPKPVEEPPIQDLLKRVSKPVVAPAKTCRIKRVKTPGRPKKVSSRGFIIANKSEGSRSARSLYSSEVEEKLDKLLNDQGGLVKKKDTPKQYLKLLVISTASGDASTEGTSCSMRDLSLLLDAMLKTTSRSILTEVIQKNGLQLLHNLVKQSRKSWTKIPILRKLMKVLELLAERKILKTKHMTSTPPRNGMESFVKSIFELTRHDDMEVQQISRRFQKNWLPDMFDLLANDKSSGNPFVHKYWGPDRFSQKRELFRSKPEERHKKPLFKHSDDHEKDDEDDKNSEQERKRRKRISRWDELPTGFSSQESKVPSPAATSSITQQHSGSSGQDSRPPEPQPEADEPPGYPSASSAAVKMEHHQVNGYRQSDHRQFEQCPQQQAKENWNRPQFRPPYRPPNGQTCYMGGRQQQQQQQQPYMNGHHQAQMEMPARGPPAHQPYAGVQHHHHYQPPKFQQRPQPMLPPPVNGYRPHHQHHHHMNLRGPPPQSSQFRSMSGYFPPAPHPHAAVQAPHHHHQAPPGMPPQIDEEPPVPGL